MRPLGRRNGDLGRGGRSESEDGGRPWRGAGRHGRGRGGVLVTSELRILLLSPIAAEARHGYHLIRSIERLSGGEYVPSPGLVYPALAAMEDLGLVAAGNMTGPRKVFAITAAGEGELRSVAKEVDALNARLAALVAAECEQHAPVRRAMENLRMVLGDSAATLESGQAHEIAALIDATAQQIERLR